MKKIFTLITSLLLTSQLSYTQNDTLWKTGGIFNVMFSQVSLSNWAAGGENSVALNGMANMFAYHKKDNINWDTNLDLGYGLTRQGEEKTRKNDDRIELNSKFGYNAYHSKLFYTLLFNFRSQFAPGYNYPRADSSNYISKFAAPAFTLLAAGMDYKPVDYFSLFISPITARYVIVNDDSLSQAGAFGVNPGETVRSEIGAYLNTRIQKEVVKNVTVMSKLDLFSNYKESPENIDVNWEILISMKVNKFISASIGAQVIYDDNTAIPLFTEKNGVRTPVLDIAQVQKTGPRTQFRQIFAIGFNYKLQNNKIR